MDIRSEQDIAIQERHEEIIAMMDRRIAELRSPCVTLASLESVTRRAVLLISAPLALISGLKEIFSISP